LLDFALYAFGTPVALEAIHWGSYDNPLDHYLRSPQAHNQVVVNDAPLDWVNCQREEVVWVTGQGLDYFLAQHRGYTQAFGVTIQRQVLFLKPDYFLVSDTIFAGPQHQSYTWYLHSPYKWQVGKTRCVTMAHPGLQVIPAQLAEIRHIRRGTAYEARDGAPGPYANRYWIGLQKWMTGAGEAAVLYDIALVPFRHTPDPVKVSRLPVRIDGRHARPETARGLRMVRGRQTDLVVYGGTGETSVTCNHLRFQGRFCVLSLQEGTPRYVAVTDGGEVSYRGQVLMRSSTIGVSERHL
jgi:hypothetical protein